MARAGFEGDCGMTAVIDAGVRWTASEWTAAVEQAQSRLRLMSARVVASVLDNGAAFMALDEAIRAIGCVHVPLPAFFTSAQVDHALRATGADTLIVEPVLSSHWQGLTFRVDQLAGQAVAVASLPFAPVQLPTGTATVTFTSGSTGDPKGVCLSACGLQEVADGIVQALAPWSIERHLCALPFAVLLEHVAGFMAGRRQGATVIARPLASLGLGGAVQFDPARFDATVRETAPNSLILLPQMLRAWVHYLRLTAQMAAPSLRVVAVGGAAAGAALLQSARTVGIPAFEGWGLSEAGSVQTLNLPGAARPGSVGRVLPHARVRVADDGELWVAGALFLGYLGGVETSDLWWPTGDIGHVDADGYVHIDGRKRNVLITAWGRNVSPEWVETALRASDAVFQAVVLGDGEPSLSAVLWPTRPQVSDPELQSAVDAANAGLPDYARVGRWVRAGAAFDAATGMATPNGRPRREAIRSAHATLLGLRATPSQPLTHHVAD